jgi:hypothetical protein
MGLTNFPNGVSSFGVPILGGSFLPATQGNVFHVKPSTGLNGNDGSSPDRAFKTLSYALGKCTANQNDIVLLYAESSSAASTFDMLTSALVWNKNAVHLIGVSAAPLIGSRAGIRNSTSTLAIEDLFTVSASNCIIANLEIFQGDVTSTASAPRAMVVSGDRNKIINCQVSGVGDLSMDLANACSLAVTGSENYFGNDFIGLDTVLRTTSATDISISSSGTRNFFDRCTTNTYTANTSYKAITIAAGSYHTATFLRDMVMCAETNRTSVAIPTGAILHSAVGSVFMVGGGVLGYANVSTVTNANIILLSYAGLATHATLPGIGAGQQTT